MEIKAGIQKKILRNTALIAIVIAAVLMIVMVFFMRSLTNDILLETLLPMAKTASQSVEGNLHMMADRIFMIGDNESFLNPGVPKEEKQKLLDRAKSGIEFVWLALYSPDGSLYTGSAHSPSSISGTNLHAALQETLNLVVDDTKVTQNGLEIIIGAPILAEDGSALYFLLGSYKYDVLNDVLSNINVGKTGTAFIINETGQYMAHHETVCVTNQDNLFHTYGEDEWTQKLAQQMIQGQTGVFESGSYLSRQYFSYSPVRGTKWSLAITAPESDFLAPANRAVLLSLGITALLLFGAGLMMIRTARGIQKPLGRVTGRIATLAQGDLYSPVEIEATKDETEILSRALANTVHSINTYTSELSRVMRELSNSNLDVSVDGSFHGDFIAMKHSLNQIVEFLNLIVREIQQAAVEVAATSYQVNESAAHIEFSSSGQADSLSKLQDKTAIINENVDEVDRHTNDMRRYMEKTTQSMSEGKAHMDDMMSSMNKINDHSIEIKKINTFLEEIALQTHILALNASIEAAKAGASGRGFEVVAKQIRELASKSTTSSRQTAEIIDASQIAIAEGVKRARLTSDSILEISQISDHVAQISEALSKAVDTEKEALDVIMDQIGEINQLAQNNLDNSRQSSTASHTLTRQAEKLEQMVQRFQLKK